MLRGFLILLQLVVCCGVNALTQKNGIPQTHTQNQPRVVPSSTIVSPPTVAIINTMPFHQEVFIAIAHAVHSMGSKYMVYAGISWFKTPGIGKSFNLSESIKFVNEMELNATEMDILKTYDILVFPSAEFKHDMDIAFAACQNIDKLQKIIFILHEPSVMKWGKFTTGLYRYCPFVHLVALSPHVARKFTETIRSQGDNRTVYFYGPLFPIDTAVPYENIPKQFSLQGKLDVTRRDYGSLMSSIDSPQYAWPSSFKLVILGKPYNLMINTTKSERMEFKMFLPYSEYYTVIQKTIGLLTSFNSVKYITEKTSSTIGASLITGTPLVITRRALASYSFLSASSVWIQNFNESDVDAMYRIISMPNVTAEFKSRYMSLQQDIRAIHVHNKRLMHYLYNL